MQEPSTHAIRGVRTNGSDAQRAIPAESHSLDANGPNTDAHHRRYPRNEVQEATFVLTLPCVS